MRKAYAQKNPRTRHDRTWAVTDIHRSYKWQPAPYYLKFTKSKQNVTHYTHLHSHHSVYTTSTFHQETLGSYTSNTIYLRLV